MQHELTQILTQGLKGAEEPQNLEAVTQVTGEDLLKARGVEPAEEPEAVEQTQAEEPDESTGAEAESREDGEYLESINKLAEELGVDESAIYDLKFNFSNGDSATLGQLKDRWQERVDNSETAERQQQELAEAQRKLDIERNALLEQQQIPNELVEAQAALLKAQADFNAIDWTTLESTNPGEASLHRQKLMEQIQQASWQKQSVENRLQQMQAGLEAQKQQQIQQYQSERQKTLHQLIPDWADDVVMKRDQRDMAELLADKFRMPEQVAEFISTMAEPTVTAAMRRLYQLEKAGQHVKESPPLPRVVKPQAVKGTYLKGVSVSATMSPGIRVAA